MSRSDKQAGHGRLVADGGAEHVEIEVLDGELEPVLLPCNLGRVEAELPLGAYAIRFRAGNSLEERLVMLARAGQVARVELDQPLAFRTTVPAARGEEEDGGHRAAVERLARGPAQRPLGAGTGSLLLFVRGADRGEVEEFVSAVSLWTGNGDPLDVTWGAADGETSEEARGALLDLPRGPYLLKYGVKRDAGTEQALFVCRRPRNAPSGWRTYVFMGLGPFATELDGPGPSSLVSLIGPSSGGAPSSKNLVATEAALRRLAAGRGSVASEDSRASWRAAENPILGLCLALSQFELRKPDWRFVEECFEELLGMIGPVPDVLALGWALLERFDSATQQRIYSRLIRAFPITVPSILRASWSLLLDARSHESSLLARGSLAEDLSGHPIAAGPWLVWYRSTAAASAECQGQEISRLLTARATEKKTRRYRALEKQLRRRLRKKERAGLHSLLSEIVESLEKTPEMPYLLRSSRFTNLERQVAQFLTPMADPLMHRVLRSFPGVRDRLEWCPEATDYDALAVSLGLSLAATQRAVWGLWSKLILLPLIPSRKQLEGFIRLESHNEGSLKRILEDLWRVETPIRHVDSKRVLNGLQFAYLRYGGSELFSDEAPSAEEVARLLNRVGFAWGPDSSEITVDDLGSLLSDLRGKVRARLESVRDEVQEALPGFSVEEVLPPSSQYRPGRLLSVPAEMGPLRLTQYSRELAERSKTLRKKPLVKLRYRIGGLLAGLGAAASASTRERRNQDYLELNRRVDNLTLRAAFKSGGS